jgi:hypothetical protein
VHGCDVSPGAAAVGALPELPVPVAPELHATTKKRDDKEVATRALSPSFMPGFGREVGPGIQAGLTAP